MAKESQPKNVVPQGKAPYYHAKERGQIQRFLAAQLLGFQKQLTKWEGMAGKDRNVPPFAGQIQYCRNAISILAILAERATQRQRHLIEFDTDPIDHILDTWKQLFAR